MSFYVITATLQIVLVSVSQCVGARNFGFANFPPARLPAILARARCTLLSYCGARSLNISITSEPTVSYLYCKYYILVVPGAHHSLTFILMVQEGTVAQ
jgi:hypothetical protein